MAKQMIDSRNTPTQEQIARRAYEIFVERGQPSGQDLAHWLEAEKQLRAAGQPKATAQTSSAAQISNASIRATHTATDSNGKTPSNGRNQARAGARK